MNGEDKPGPAWKRKGLGIAAALIILIVLVIFLGFNISYLVPNG